MLQRVPGSSLVRFLLVVPMIGKETRDLSLQRRRLLLVADAAVGVEELPLEFPWNSIPVSRSFNAG